MSPLRKFEIGVWLFIVVLLVAAYFVGRSMT